MSGWWVVGSVSEAAFFGVLFLLGIASLTIVVSWQVFWPNSTLWRPGFGFWLMVCASISFIVIGLTAFILRVSQTLASPEMRSAMASEAKRAHQRRAESDSDGPANLPDLQALTDSPGVKLSYRLASQKGENTQLILSTLFATAWNSVLAVLVVVTLQQFLSGGTFYFLAVLLVGFMAVGFFATRWFFRLFTERIRIGPTAVEIDSLPMLPGNQYRLYLCQYGRVEFRKLDVALVSYEETTYEQGTDVRTEVVETFRVPVKISGHFPAQKADRMFDRKPVRPSADEPVQEDSTSCKEGLRLQADPEVPLELDCRISLPLDIMHSFHSEHNALVWKILVEGESAKWPAFCRSFPVAVYPNDAI